MDKDNEKKISHKDDPRFCIGSSDHDPDYPIIKVLKRIIRYAVVVLAITMTFVIIWGVGDVIWVLVNRLQEPPFMLLSISDILATFGAFIAVLIAIEIFVNITLYLDGKIIHVKLVLATALMAIARKVIIFDYDKLGPEYVWATAAVILALCVGYWLVDE
ncbi:MAG: hypothetical protein D5R98_04535 [Desulfonatronovibrio sp. MSAO_Bac4]|nr:MAG: hypothetical protein D5R98_04535 [Desulfonatronovibrio sp. MSAO_Bac4]